MKDMSSPGEIPMDKEDGEAYVKAVTQYLVDNDARLGAEMKNIMSSWEFSRIIYSDLWASLAAEIIRDKFQTSPLLSIVSTAVLHEICGLVAGLTMLCLDRTDEELYPITGEQGVRDARAARTRVTSDREQ